MPTSVNYVNGYPDFSDYMQKSKRASQTIKLTGNREKDFALDDIPPGEMKLVRTDIHKEYSHIGGYSVGK